MECPSERKDSSELVIAYIDGSLDPATRLAFERHLERCSVCREITALQSELWAALDAWAPTPLSPEFNQQLYQRIAAEKNKPSWAWRQAMPLAAACLALVVVLWFRSPAPEPIAGNSEQTFTPQIEQVESALEDIEMLKQLSLPAPDRQEL